MRLIQLLAPSLVLVATGSTTPPQVVGAPTTSDNVTTLTLPDGVTFDEGARLESIAVCAPDHVALTVRQQQAIIQDINTAATHNGDAMWFQRSSRENERDVELGEGATATGGPAAPPGTSSRNNCFARYFRLCTCACTNLSCPQRCSCAQFSEYWTNIQESHRLVAQIDEVVGVSPQDRWRIRLNAGTAVFSDMMVTYALMRMAYLVPNVFGMNPVRIGVFLTEFLGFWLLGEWLLDSITMHWFQGQALRFHSDVMPRVIRLIFGSRGEAAQNDELCQTQTMNDYAKAACRWRYYGRGFKFLSIQCSNVPRNRLSAGPRVSPQPRCYTPLHSAGGDLPPPTRSGSDILW